LLRTTFWLPPAIHNPVPTGAGMNGSTSEPGWNGLKLLS
jgi:hypothetical protein